MPRKKVEKIYNLPLMSLVYQASRIHNKYFSFQTVQMANLLSIKTGSCPEDCSYCSQSSHYKTFVTPEKLIEPEVVLQQAERAKKLGATRFCMGGAWRSIPRGDKFKTLLKMVKEVSSLGLQTCFSMGMLSLQQAKALKKAGLYAYNHNIDTSPRFYSKIITTRTFQDRLESIRNIQKAKLSLCCGGILGLGETHEDRIDFINVLSKLRPRPDSVPINTLVPVEGTKLEATRPIPFLDIIRVIATVRCIIPKSVIRLSAGRLRLSHAEQTLCFFSGANSIFVGDKLLTTNNNAYQEDINLLKSLGLQTGTL